MKENILIVEDEFIVANDLSLILRKAGYTICGIAASVQEAKAWVEKHQPTWVLLDIFLQDGSKGTDLAGYLTEKKIGFVYISANTNQKILEAAKLTQPYGFLVKPFREKDLLIMLEIATEKHRQNMEFDDQREAMLRKQIGYIINSAQTKEEKLALIPNAFQALIPFDYMKLNVLKHNELGVNEFSFMRLSFDSYQLFKNTELPESMNLLRKDMAAFKPILPEYKKATFYNGMDFRQHMFDSVWERLLCSHFDFQSELSFPLTLDNGVPASLSFYSKKSDSYTASNVSLLRKVGPSIRALVAQATQKWGVQVSEPQPQRIANVSQPVSFDGIVGDSPALLKVLDSISLVSQSDLSVLITGESGTGKEKVAQNIHKLSKRKLKPLITVNCAALPHELIESELFGHEKGAYTGAIAKRTGKFELANGGTIFLDEIGEMPLDAQVKLLRVLQEKEIDQLGSKQTIKIDVRVIAATNRKLEKEVAEGRFRLDLYYRLNVFPIDMPTLRSRKEDIAPLALHFLKVYAKDTGRKIEGFSQHAMKQLQAYDWPGNIRELGHLIQRAMIMASGPVINEISIPETISDSRPFQNEKEAESKTLEQIEAEHILAILKKCKGKVCGTGGAAEILGLPPSTLNSKIKKLGIKRESYFNF